jgi:hypothetical protein
VVLKLGHEAVACSAAPTWAPTSFHAARSRSQFAAFALSPWVSSLARLRRKRRRPVANTACHGMVKTPLREERDGVSDLSD